MERKLLQDKKEGDLKQITVGMVVSSKSLLPPIAAYLLRQLFLLPRQIPHAR